MIFFTELLSHRRQPYIEKAWSKYSVSLNVTESWRFEEPKPLRGEFASLWGRGADWTARPNSKFSEFCWRHWHNHPDRRDVRPPDCLGLCLWDYKRLYYLGLHESLLDFSLGPPKKPDMNFSSPKIWKRWVDLFLHELTTSPGGEKRKLSRDCKKRIGKWKTGVRLEANRRGFI